MVEGVHSLLVLYLAGLLNSDYLWLVHNLVQTVYFTRGESISMY